MKYLPTVIATVLILIAVLISGSNIPDVSILGFDKLVHFVLFFTWIIAVRYDFPSSKFFLIVLSGLIFSVFTELLQLVAEDRSFDWYDILLDGVGISIGIFMAPRIIKTADEIYKRNRN